MVKVEGTKAGTIEAIMVNQDNQVLECTGDNIFVVSGGKLYTPPTHLGVLEGITRNAIIELAAKLNIPFEEKILMKEELFTADEIFLTGTAAEVIPVVEVDKNTIGSGKPGELTNQFLSQFKELVKTDGVKYEL